MVCKILARISSRFSLMKTNKQMRLGSDITFFNLFRGFIFDFGRPILTILNTWMYSSTICTIYTLVKTKTNGVCACTWDSNFVRRGL